MASPLAARWVWAFKLSQANGQGIEGSVPGLAIAAHVSLDECQAAIDALLAPDKYSRTKDLEGRRLVEVDGGWQIVSYPKWRFKFSAEERKAYKRHHEQTRRDRSRADGKRSTAEVVRRVTRIAAGDDVRLGRRAGRRDSSARHLPSIRRISVVSPSEGRSREIGLSVDLDRRAIALANQRLLMLLAEI
jgi:hypothetical protein